MKNVTEEIKIPKASKKIKLDKDMAKRISKTELLSYTIKAVIPTGPYGNIQPEIIVMADSLEEAESYVIPHINKLFRDFLNKSERIDVQAPTPTGTSYATSGTTTHTAEVSQAFMKANQALKSCLSKDALDLIQSQIEKSIKLNDNEKVMLIELSIIKSRELSAKQVK